MLDVLVGLFSVLLGYLLGSVNPAIIITRTLCRDDVRNRGSKNAGTTNVMRIYGKKLGILVFVLDFLKGILAIIAGRWLYHLFGANSTLSTDYLSCLAVLLGHCLPIFFGFRGGKAVATAAGCLLIINPIILSIGLSVFIAVTVKTNTIGYGSVFAALSLPASSLILALINEEVASELVFVCAVSLIVLVAHKIHVGNLIRLMKSRRSVDEKDIGG